MNKLNGNKLTVNNEECQYIPIDNRHIIYRNKDGYDVPSVTTILQVLNKPFLVKWANVMGFKRTKTEDILKEASTIGTITHDMIENFIMNGTIKMSYPEFSDNNIMGKCINAFNGFKSWWKENKDRIEIIFMENSLCCETYGGTIDLYCKLDGITTIIDFKTSNNMSSSMYIQLMAYKRLIDSNGYEPVQDVAILKLSKKTIEYEYIDVETSKISTFINFFNTLLDAFYIEHNIKDKFKDILKGEIL